jgi:tetratricopeptide (TPR) repeat protein
VLRLKQYRLFLAIPLLPLAAGAAERETFELQGQLRPARFAFVAISSVSSPYNNSAPVYWDGKFKFKNLEQGSYVISVYIPRIGEFRQTCSVGPSTADKKGHVKITFPLHPSRLTNPSRPKDRHTISISKLSISEKAWKEYFEAQKLLRKNNIEAAEKRLLTAVELAPQFAQAWNHLGTIAYQTRRFELSEERFREAHKQDPEAFEPVVNLGGALLSLRKPQDALPHNVDAVKRRPNDALANAQLGLNYYFLGQLNLALRYLGEARRIDPGHFSNPQLTMAEIYQSLRQYVRAADELDHFLRYHPDHSEKAQILAAIRKLRAAPLH